MADLFLAGVGVVVALVGAYLVRNTVKGILQARKRHAAALSNVADIDPGEGLVKVEGTVEPATEETFRAFVDGNDAVFALTSLEERRGSRDDTGGPQWHPTEKTVQKVPFYVVDDTGRVRVEVPEIVTGYRLMSPGLDPNTVGLELELSELTTRGRSVPDSISDLFEVTVEEDEPYRFRQGSLEPGETAYVIGYPERAMQDVDAEVTISGGDNPEDVVIADKDPEEVESGSVALSVFGLLIALGILGFGLWLLIGGLGFL